MIYSKNALTVEQQADQLINRGLIADRDQLVARLNVVNYYRISGYLYPFREIGVCGKRKDTFAAGTTLDMVWRRYNFDRRLRILLLDAIERIEVAIRTRLVYHFVQAHGPFGHLKFQNLPGFKKTSDHQQWLRGLKEEQRRSREQFVTHFRERYGDHHDQLPLWMACELMTCGSTLQLMFGIEHQVVRKVSAEFGFPDQQLLSWTKALFALRNSCAHHSRVWNRVFGAKPSVPGKNKNPQWHTEPTFDNRRVGFMLTICHLWLQKISATSQWKTRLFELFDEYPEIPVAEIGLPPNWRSHDLWK